MPAKPFNFYPDSDSECEICGIRSFAHRHHPETSPKDFEPLKVPSDHLPKKPMTMSQLLRAVLFRRWEHECGPKRMSAEEFYEREMLRIIDHEKAKL